MRTLAIDINDSGLVVADEDRVLAVEPGYALADGGKLTTGAAAHGQARLKPRQVSSRYWSTLSLEPGSAGVNGGHSAAELAFAQLDSLWQRYGNGASDVVFVVPGFYSREQLGLLLGLAEECRIPVKALVDAAVAASARPYPSRQLVYVDAGLHRVSVTPLRQTDEAIAEPEQGLPTTGLAHATDMLARWVAERFVLATRFDPFHRATSEQELYDRLPTWLHELHDEEQAELTLSHADEEFTVSVKRDDLLGVIAGFNRAIVQLIAQAREADMPLVVQLSERLTSLPGLASQLTRLDDARVVHLPTGHAARAALFALNGVEAGGGVKLKKHLRWREPADEEPGRAVDAPQSDTVRNGRLDDSVPTHIVYRGIAYPVDGDGLTIVRVPVDGRRAIVIDGEAGGLSRLHCEIVFRDGELKLRDLSRYGTFVNEKRIADDTVLHVADVIRIGSPGAELQVVRVADGHGA